MYNIVVKKKVIEDAISTLKRIPCTFRFCPGWGEPFVDMATCQVCATVQNLEAEIKGK